MRKRSRVIAIVSVVAVLSTVAAVFALTAKADPPGLAVDGNNGYKVQRFTHPDNPAWFVEVAVDTQRGLQESTSAVWLSGVARISKGAGVARVQVDAIRLGIGPGIVNDFFPSKTFGARDNTPAGCTTSSGTTRNRYADVSPAVDCQPGPDGLNSAADYAPDVNRVLGYSDWVGPVGCREGTVATRGFFSVRWANADFNRFTLLSDRVEANPEC